MKWQGCQPYTTVGLTPLSLRDAPGTLFLEAKSTDRRATMTPEELSQWKILMTSFGIEPATFRLVAQCLNDLPYRVHLNLRYRFGKKAFARNYEWYSL